MPKWLSFLGGTLFLGLGALGIIVPGLPTTIFWIVAAGFYVKSSDRLYHWLINHKKYGSLIQMYRDHRAISARGRVISLVSMWSMIILSVILFSLEGIWIMLIILPLLGTGGTVMILRLKVYEKENVCRDAEPLRGAQKSQDVGTSGKRE